MPRYLSPGVFVEEVSFSARPINGGSTSTACFLGRIGSGHGPAGVPTFVTSYADFIDHFGQGTNLDQDPFAAAIRGFFDNGGGRAYIVRISSDATSLHADDLVATSNIMDISLVACPGMTDVASHETLISHCEARSDRFAVLEISPEFTQASEMRHLATNGGGRPRDADGGVAAIYAPWIDVVSPAGSPTMRIGPSGHVCGAYARNDIERGVHRTPANLTLRGVIGLAQDFSSVDLEMLNAAHINVIRTIPGRGIRIWGGRTLSGPTSDYKYVPVRRLAIFIHEAISNGTDWAVFEPNNHTLWRSVQRGVSGFLTSLWREGALRGDRPEQAFFVKCGTETMSRNDIDQGRLILHIGFAPVRPAEFVVLRITQKTMPAR